MSDGPRIPLADADKAAAYVLDRWGMSEPDCLVVGSVRRRRPNVGDLELVAPWEDEHSDRLYERIAATVVGVAKLPSREDLFSAMGRAPTASETPKPPIGEARQGLKPGFLHARLSLWRRDRTLPPIPCEVYRYTAENRGWQTLMRTGPAEFGICFLTWWKQRFGIPMGEGGKASIEGHLVDATGRVVPVRSEEEAFSICGAKFIAPERRDEFAADWSRANRRARV